TVLALLGVRMLWGAFSGAEEKYRSDPTRGLSLVTLSVATSLDALAAGAAMGLGGLKVMGMFEASLIIGIVCAAVTFAGILLGSKLGSVFERRARALGGLLLLAVGLKVGAGL
ncbi:MAG: manganese efflux pump, partial [Candidatus Brocadiia bacterium]